MDRVRTYGPLDEMLFADLNAMQDRAAGVAQLAGFWIDEAPALATPDLTTVAISPVKGLFFDGLILSRQRTGFRRRGLHAILAGSHAVTGSRTAASGIS